MSDIRYCERCGAPLIPGSRSCDNCGMQQSSRQQQTDIRPPYHPGHSIPRVNRGQGQNQNYSQQQPVSQPGQRRNPRPTEPEDSGRRQRVQQPIPDRSQPQTVSQPGPGRKPHPTELRDSGRRQRTQQSVPNYRQRAQQPMPNHSQRAQQPMPNQNPARPQQNPRPYRVDDGWEQSWERMGADEDERRFTPAQCVLIGIIVVSLAALLAFGIFWVGLKSSDRSARDRIGVQPPAVNQNAQPMDASPTGGTSADQNAQSTNASPADQNVQPTGATSGNQNDSPTDGEAQPTGDSPVDQKTSPEESPDQNTQPDDGTADIIILN